MISVVGFVVIVLILAWNHDKLRRRVKRLEYGENTDCPYLKDCCVDQYKPCLDGCPCYAGVCYRWHICMMGEKRLEEDQKDASDK